MRPVCETIKHVLDNTKVEHLATNRQVEALTDELCKALAAEGYKTHGTDAIMCGGEPTTEDRAIVESMAEGMRSVPEPYRSNHAAAQIWVDGFIDGARRERTRG